MIRIIHTSDWHLGLELNEHNRLEEQELFLNWLLDQSVAHKIDALLVSGDIYDVINPSIEAQALFAKFVVNFNKKLPLASLIVIGGNHDSGMRMEITRPFSEALGNLHIVGSLNEADSNLFEKHVIQLTNQEGIPSAWCLAIPFLRADDLICKVGESETRDKAFSRSISNIYSKLRDHAINQNQNLPIIAMGHLTALGSNKSGSERILIGGVESVSAESISHGVDYVALGHIHRSQQVFGKKVQYCGSPISIDFDERKYQHQVLLVELDNPGKEPIITSLKIPQMVEFIRFSEEIKSWDEVELEINNYNWERWLDKPRNLHPFVDIQFNSDGIMNDLREKTEVLLKKYPIRLVSSPRRIVQASVNEEKSISASNVSQVDLKSKDTPLNIFMDYYLKKYQHVLPEDLNQCFVEILDEVKIEGNN
jgi:exonuclease SbcD